MGKYVGWVRTLSDEDNEQVGLLENWKDDSLK